jgi:hypothetical protein
MIGQMNTLLRLKTMKEEQALRTLQAKRRQVADGEAAVATANARVAESAATLPTREDAIYAGILGRVVNLGDLDDTRGAVVDLEKGHARLADAAERAAHVLHRLNGELDTAVGTHRAAVRVRDKYTILRDDLREQADAEANAREEGEIEELFTKGRKDPAKDAGSTGGRA